MGRSDVNDEDRDEVGEMQRGTNEFLMRERLEDFARDEVEELGAE